MSDWFKAILDKFRAPREEPLPFHPPNAPYPIASEDLDLARRAGFGYETGNDQIYKRGVYTQHLIPEYGRGQTLEQFMAGADKHLKSRRNLYRDNPEVADMQLAAGLASNRSGIASLGYDPRKFAVDPTPAESRFGGLYDPAIDAGWVSVKSPSSLTHEAIHRGIRKMRDVSEPAYGLRQDDEESLVRYIMRTRMGDPENRGEESVRDYWNSVRQYDADKAGDPRPALERQERADQIEREARTQIAKRRPYGGPR
jgi:hypothetical protein